MRFLQEHVGDICKGAGSLGFTALAAISGAQEQVEFGLRCFMYGAAGFVSLLTAWSIWRKNRAK